MLNLTNACWRWREVFLVLVACLLEASVHQIFSKAQFCSINDFSSRGFEMCDSFRVFRITQWGCFSGQTSESIASIIPHSFPLLLKKYLFLFVCVRKKEGASTNVCLLACTPMHMQTAEGALTLLRYQTPSIPLLSDSIYSFEVGSFSELRAQTSARLEANKPRWSSCHLLRGAGDKGACRMPCVFCTRWDLNSGT